MAERPRDDDVKVLLRNRRARHEYEVLETLEAGIALRGAEVKSLRDARASLGDAYATVKGGEMILAQMQIEPYPNAHAYDRPDPRRDRRLLLHRKEIDKLGRAIDQKGCTLLPLEVYLRRGRVKVLLGVARGKKLHDKRAAAKERETTREDERELARYRK
jgi:SsrA-binding protein